MRIAMVVDACSLNKIIFPFEGDGKCCVMPLELLIRLL